MKEKVRNRSLRNPGIRATIKAAILKWIADQKLVNGDRIHGQIELAHRFGVTQVTMFRALRELTWEGKVHRKNGKGTFVGPDLTNEAHRAMCLVLPGEGLDKPEYNPQFWPEIQTLVHIFTKMSGGRWSFTPKPVALDCDVKQIAKDLIKFDAVFFHHSKEPAELLRYLTTKTKIPVIAFGQPVNAFPCLTVDYSRESATCLGVSHLLKLGYRHIVMIDSRKYFRNMNWDGYRQALEDFGVPFDKDLIIQSDFTQDGASHAIADLLKKGVKFDAVFAVSDMLALSILDVLRRSGKSVPEQIGVMGFDGIDYACHLPPFLTSVEIPRADMIYAVLNRLDANPGNPTNFEYLDFPCRILPGKTTRQQTRK